MSKQSSVLSQVREACKHYDKPERIGKLPLATVALQSLLLQNPNHPTDLIGRGNALRQVIDLTLEGLKQPEQHSSENEVYLCLYCHIYERDPYSRAAVDPLRYLAIQLHHSKSNIYNKLRKKYYPQLSYEISSRLAKNSWLEPIPRVDHFVEREKKKRKFYEKKLKRNGFVLIEGRSGVGKTALGSEIAASMEAKRPVCWITIRSGINDNAMGVLSGWASFLAKEGYPQLWAFMYANANESRNLADFFPHLRKGLKQVRPLLCIDNLELLPEQERSFWSLLEMVQKIRKTDLLLISQPRDESQEGSQLVGFSVSEVQEFMHSWGIELGPEQIETLTHDTGGNPLLLKLWIADWRLQDKISESVQNNFTFNSFFISKKIISALSPSQQRAALLLALARRPLDSFLLQTPSLFGDLPSLTEFDLEAGDLSEFGMEPKELSELGIEMEDFATLQRLGLIEHYAGNKWTLSDLLTTYLSQSLPKELINDKTTLHQWLAGLYILQGNLIEAAYHAIEGAKKEWALFWLVNQQHELIAQGQAHAMSVLLNRIPRDELNSPMQQLWHTLRHDINLVLSYFDDIPAPPPLEEYDASITFDDVYDIGMLGKIVIKQGQVSQAHDYYRKALSLLAAKRSTLQPWLHGELAWALMEQNDLEKASDEAERAQITLKNILGNIADLRGNLDLAIKHFQEGIVLGEEKGEDHLLTHIYNNLALTYWRKGQFDQAIDTFETNLKKIKSIGELVSQAATLLNIGICYTQIGLNQPEKAINYFHQTLPIFTTLKDVRGQMMAHFNLAEQYLLTGQLDSALKYAKKATEVKQTEVSKLAYLEALRIYAEVLLMQGQADDALEKANQALEDLRVPNTTADQFSDPFYAKLTCETLVKIYEKLGNKAEMRRYRELAKQLERKMQG